MLMHSQWHVIFLGIRDMLKVRWNSRIVEHPHWTVVVLATHANFGVPLCEELWVLCGMGKDWLNDGMNLSHRNGGKMTWISVLHLEVSTFQPKSSLFIQGVFWCFVSVLDHYKAMSTKIGEGLFYVKPACLGRFPLEWQLILNRVKKLSRCHIHNQQSLNCAIWLLTSNFKAYPKSSKIFIATLAPSLYSWGMTERNSGTSSSG